MNTTKRFVSFFGGFSLMLFIAGCSLWTYGKIRVEYPSDGGMAIDTLYETWQNYHVYYSGLYMDQPGGVLFDPKGDDRTLEGDAWKRLEDKESIATVLMWLRTMSVHYRPYLYRMLGPDDAFYGYVYTPYRHVVLKQVDERTLAVNYLPPPDTTIRERYRGRF